MALKINFTTNQGIISEEAYCKITAISGGKENMTLNLCIFYNEEVYQSGKEQITTNQYVFKPILESQQNFIAQGYEYLKSLEEFKDSEDC